MIGGWPVEYTIETKNITAVLGSGYIYPRVTYNEMLLIIYRGLKSSGGYSAEEFVTAVQRGEIYASRRRNHFHISAMRPRILARIRQVNRQRAMDV